MKILKSLLAVATFAAATGAALPAGATTLPDLPGIPCSNPVSAAYFSSWGDQSQYFLAPGASFAPGAAYPWLAMGGAQAVPGGDPWDVTGTATPYSALLPAGGIITSQDFCVDSTDTAIRFFYLSPGTPDADLKVMLATVGTNGVAVKVVDVSGGTAGWQVSDPVQLPTLLGTEGNEDLVISFIAPLNSAPWQVDDVMVDPFASN